MTALQAEAEKKFGSLRKLAMAIELSPGAIHQVAAGHRKAWPKLRRSLGEALGIPDATLFDENGMLKEAC